MLLLSRVSCFFEQFWEGLLDIVYPPFCLVCGKPGDQYLCTECANRIEIIEYPYCSRCGIPRTDSQGSHCECSGRNYHFVQARCVGIYDGVLRDAIHAFKYDLQTAMTEPLAQLMVREFPRLYPGLKPDLVVPVPIHRDRFLERGFNQSGELALRIAAALRFPFDERLMKKEKKTLDQVGLPESQRSLNLQGAFVVTHTRDVWGKKVLLIDDVFTTGATANEVAKALRWAGAASVYVYALARSV